MCLGVPGQLKAIFEEDGLRMGKVQFSGVVRTICLALVPEAEAGDYLLVHVGFALTRIDRAEAQRTAELFAELDSYDPELAPGKLSRGGEPT